jgi:tRNA-modifying protein YgfZ
VPPTATVSFIVRPVARLARHRELAYFSKLRVSTGGAIMANGYISELGDRGLVKVGGEDAKAFLQGLVTCDIDTVTRQSAAYGALLTPQGKILFDFLVYAAADGYLLDLDVESVAGVVKRLSMYKLRAKVDVTDVSDTYGVIAACGALDGATLPENAIDDPRLAALGKRAIVARDALAAALEGSDLTRSDLTAYHAHRVALGVPHGGRDFEFNQAFPHDADMDALNGVAFSKGCYVGQEVVSRMKHRGTARKRIIQIKADTALPAPGTEISADGKTVGTLGSTDGAHGLALVRIDRVADAKSAGTPIVAGDTAVTLTLPDWATFGWPETASEVAGEGDAS